MSDKDVIIFKGTHREEFPPVGPVSEAKPEANGHRGVGFKRAGDLIREQKAPVYLLEGILERGRTYATIGPPKHGKSMIAMDMACCIALGRDWCGKRTLKTAVFILAGEGHAGISRRLKAWSEYHGESLDDAPLFISQRAAQLLSDLDAATVANEIREMCAATGEVPGLIVIDTLNRNFGDGDENSTGDMTRFVAHLDQYLAPLGATIKVVHHTPLASRDRPRGSSALLGAVDGVFLVAKDDDGGKVTRFRIGDQKDAASGGDDLAFLLKGQDLPGVVDNFGNQVTAVVAEQTDAAVIEASFQPAGKNQQLAMRVLRDMYAEPVGEGITRRVSVDEWRDRFIDALMDAKGMKRDSARGAWKDVRDAAQNNPWCVLEGPHAYPPEIHRQMQAH